MKSNLRQYSPLQGSREGLAQALRPNLAPPARPEYNNNRGYNPREFSPHRRYHQEAEESNFRTVKDFYKRPTNYQQNYQKPQIPTTLYSQNSKYSLLIVDPQRIVEERVPIRATEDEIEQAYSALLN